MAFQAIDAPTTTTKFVEIITAIDNLLVIRGTSADPNADVNAAEPGIFYFNTTTKQLWLCTTEGTAGVDVVWEPIIFSVQAATTDAAGIVELATSSEVTAGDATDKAVTPASIKNVYPLKSYVDAADAVLNSLISSTNSIAQANEADLASATDAATASKLIRRDGSGRAKIANASLSTEIVNKGQMDAADTALQNQIDAHDVVLDAATDAATGNTIAKRDVSGRLSVGLATASGHAVRKAELDALTTVVDGHTTTLNNAVSTPTASRIAKRDANGRCQFAAGSADDDAVIMSQLNSLNAEVDTNTTDISTNAGDIAVLEDLADTLLGGKNLDNLTLATDKATPTTALVKLNVQTGSLDDCTNLLTTNGVKVLFVTNADPTKPITLKHGANATDGFLENFSSSDIVLNTAGQIVIYTLVEDTTNKYVQVGAIGFGTGSSGTASLLKADSITSSLEPLPTSGNWDKPVYIHYGDWTQTGDITQTVPICKIYLKGNFTTNASYTITGNSSAVANGGKVGVAFAGNGGGYMGSGGKGCEYSNGNQAQGGSGGGNGGAGGDGGSAPPHTTPGGNAITGLSLVPGGGGGAGAGYGASYPAVTGGPGGCALYLEVAGNINIQGNVTYNGGNGTNATPGGFYVGASGAGAGGTIVTVCSGTWNLAASKTISTVGGVGGAQHSSYGDGGGGGGGRQYHRSGGVLTNSGTLSYSGGASGTGTPAYPGTSGSSGVVDTFSEVDVWSLF